MKLKHLLPVFIGYELKGRGEGNVGDEFYRLYLYTLHRPEFYDKGDEEIYSQVRTINIYFLIKGGSSRTNKKKVIGGKGHYLFLIQFIYLLYDERKRERRGTRRGLLLLPSSCCDVEL